MSETATVPPTADPAPAVPPAQPPVPAPKPGPPPAKPDQPATGEQGKPEGDGTDWKAHSRTWEDRAKEHKRTADKAAADLKAEQDRLKAIMKAAGIGEDEPDPAEAAKNAVAERDAALARVRQIEIERTAEKAALTAGADVTALLDSRAFTKALTELGEGATEQQISAAVSAALEANPRLKATPAVPARTVTDSTGGGDPKGQLSRDQLKAMSPEQIVQARKDGRLRNLLGG